MFADWQTKQIDVKGWRTQYAELNAVAIEELVAEIEAYTPPVVEETPTAE